MARRWLLALCFCGAMPFACSDEDPACFEGEFERCACGDVLGYHECVDGAYGACDCESPTPGLSPEGGSGGGLLPLFEECETDMQCESGRCYPYTSKGPHCTQTCTGGEDCPEPSPGCTPMGVCKLP
jgi:hypothetical protein